MAPRTLLLEKGARALHLIGEKAPSILVRFYANEIDVDIPRLKRRDQFAYKQYPILVGWNLHPGGYYEYYPVRTTGGCFHADVFYFLP